MQNNVLVQIGVIIYNQKNYVKQCLDGILMQKTNFKFEILINDDCSTDGTTEIIKEYEQKYPEIIKPIYQKENQFSKGKRILKNFVLPRVKCKYFALCEGDDYWTDPYKLQKQVDFMEENPDYTICFHNVKRIYQNYTGNNNQNKLNNDFSFEKLLERNFITTNSVMYRWNSVENIFDKIPEKILPGDWYLHLLFAKQGKIHFIEDTMSVYRIHDKGIWSTLKADERFIKYPFPIINFYLNVYKNITENSPTYFRTVQEIFRKISNALIRHQKIHTFFKLQFKYPNLSIKTLQNNLKLLFLVLKIQS